MLKFKLLIIFIFLLLASFVSAGNQQDLFDSLIIKAFDDTRDENDAVPGHTATITGNVELSTGPAWTGGTDSPASTSFRNPVTASPVQWVEFPNVDEMDTIGSDGWTMCFIHNFSSFPATQEMDIFSNRDGAWIPGVFQVIRAGDAEDGFRFTFRGTSTDDETRCASDKEGTSHGELVCFTASWNVAKTTVQVNITINGTQCESVAANPVGSTSIWTVNKPFLIGVNHNKGSYGIDFAISSFYLFNRTVSPEIQREVLWDSEGNFPTLVAEAPPDSTPPVISEHTDVSGGGTNKTDDTTPTHNLTTDENADCDNSADNSTWVACSTTGALGHICTIPAAQAFAIGEDKSAYVKCDDSSSNTAYGVIVYNITDAIAPIVTAEIPEEDSFFVSGDNNTITFRWNATDNHNVNLTTTLKQNTTLKYINITYMNGTDAIYITTVIFGVWQMNMSAIDNHSNQADFLLNFSVQLKENVTLFLNELSDNRKYEFRSVANISANCTGSGGSCTVCINLDSPNYGDDYVCDTNYVSFLYNITTLRQSNFTNASSINLSESQVLNVTMDNKTQMIRTALNITSLGTTSNLNITYYGNSLIFIGDLKTQYLNNDRFIHSGSFKDAVNLTYIVSGSNYIYYNLSGLSVNNLSFEVSGFDLDIDNEFSHTEHFNGTEGSVGINRTLSDNVDAPIGVYEDFNVNVSDNWELVDLDRALMRYLPIEKRMRLDVFDLPDNQEAGLMFYNDDGQADLRNTSKVQLLIRYAPKSGISGNLPRYRIYASDGTSKVAMVDKSGGSFEFINITMEKNSDDYTIWKLTCNASVCSGISDISSLDFTKQITLQFAITDAALEVDNIQFSGVWLNRSVDNGTYKSVGNFTSKVLNIATTNISRAILSEVAVYEPDNTNIKYYLSNTGNNTLPIFDEVEVGIMHVFSTVGNQLLMRAVLNSSVNITSPILRNYRVDIISSTVKNVTVDLGNDGSIDWEFLETLNATTSPKVVNFSSISSVYTTIKISSATPGTIMVDQFKVNSSINPIVLNHTAFEDCSKCSINISFGDSPIEVGGLEFDFLGSWNYTASAYSGTDFDEHFVQIYYSDFNLSLPKEIDWYDVFPSSRNSTNVSPYGQGQNIPIWNLTNHAYDEEIDIYVKTNDSMPSCLNVTYSNNTLRMENKTNETFVGIINTTIFLSNNNLVKGNVVIFNQSLEGETLNPNNYSINFTDGTVTMNDTYSDRSPLGINYSYLLHGFDYQAPNTFILNETYQKIIDSISVNSATDARTGKGIWNWWYLSGCTSAFEIPWAYFAAICSDCYFDESQLDGFNIIEA